MIIDPAWALPGRNTQVHSRVRAEYDLLHQLTYNSRGSCDFNSIVTHDLFDRDISLYEYVISQNRHITCQWPWTDCARMDEWNEVTRYVIRQARDNNITPSKIWNDFLTPTIAYGYQVPLLKWTFNIFRMIRNNLYFDQSNDFIHSSTADFICVVGDNYPLGFNSQLVSLLNQRHMVLTNYFPSMMVLLVPHSIYCNIYDRTTPIVDIWQHFKNTAIFNLGSRDIDLTQWHNGLFMPLISCGELELEYVSRPSTDESGIVSLKQLADMFNQTRFMSPENRQIIHKVLTSCQGQTVSRQ